MSFSFHPEAEDEFAAAQNFYDDQEFGLGRIFLSKVHKTIDCILKFPGSWPQSSKRTRRCFCNRFPYSIIYRHTEDQVTIYAIAHQKRKPGYWKDRLR